MSSGHGGGWLASTPRKESPADPGGLAWLSLRHNEWANKRPLFPMVSPQSPWLHHWTWGAGATEEEERPFLKTPRLPGSALPGRGPGPEAQGLGFRPSLHLDLLSKEVTLPISLGLSFPPIISLASFPAPMCPSAFLPTQLSPTAPSHLPLPILSPQQALSGCDAARPPLGMYQHPSPRHCPPVPNTPTHLPSGQESCSSLHVPGSRKVLSCGCLPGSPTGPAICKPCDLDVSDSLSGSHL